MKEDKRCRDCFNNIEKLIGLQQAEKSGSQSLNDNHTDDVFEHCLTDMCLFYKLVEINHSCRRSCRLPTSNIDTCLSGGQYLPKSLNRSIRQLGAIKTFLRMYMYGFVPVYTVIIYGTGIY